MRCRELVLVGLLAFGLLAGTARAAEDAVVIGYATALSGPYADSGLQERAAFLAAVRVLNAEGGLLGHRVKARVADDACGIEQAVNAAKTLIAAEAQAVVGHKCSHSSLMAAGLYDAESIPMLMPVSTHPRLTEEGRRNVFRLIGRDDQQAAFAADLMQASWPGVRFAILHDGSVYGEGLASRTQDWMRAWGEGPVLYQRYDPGTSDYAELVARLAQQDAQVVFVGGYGPDAGRIVLAAHEAGLDAQFLGGDGLGMDGFWDEAGASGEGTLFSDRRVDDVGPLPPELAAALDGRVRPSELSTYAGVQVWAEAVRRAGSLDPELVLLELTRGRFATVLGTVAFDPKGDLKSAAWEWHVWRAGRRIPLAAPPPSQ